jgi:hypothetical protein
MATNHVSAEDMRLCMAHRLDRMFSCPTSDEVGVSGAFERIITAASSEGPCSGEGCPDIPCSHNRREIARLSESKTFRGRHHGAR